MQNLDTMNESFEIPVMYKEQQLFFTARLIAMGYVHKFKVDVYGQELFFEQDDCGQYRALVDPINLQKANKTDVDLLKVIAASIESILA
ncbi:MAG: hypothetical protein H7Z13_20255 [Ferruginibacter sp.]|nr:hypothetical protein [Ferruginibacter sp.]